MTNSIFPEIPRLESLHHRLKTAKDPERQPVPLLDEIMVFLEDPPPGTGDRWQAAADLCARHDIPASRMAVWRFYRAHILEWRREHVPPLAEVPEQATTQLLDQGRHLLALRTLESLHHPDLPPRVLVGLVQNENRRQELQLARDKFNHELENQRRLACRQEYRAIEDSARDEVLYPFQLKTARNWFETLLKASRADEESEPASPKPDSAHNTP